MLSDIDLAMLKQLLGPPGVAQRRAVAKAITLVESTRADHRLRAEALVEALRPHAGRAFRLGVSGVPGVGKSTFIEALGVLLVEQGHRVAVLTVDPSSRISGGSILGDKTRMERLSAHERAFVRPSPARGKLGGVAEGTREALLVCEAAGHDIILVETVGAGQSETSVARMTDMFVLLLLPNAGDDLQAIKMGAMEHADLVVINKADLDKAAAARALSQVAGSLRHAGLHAGPGLGRRVEGAWTPHVLQLSALDGTGLHAFYEAVTQFRKFREASGQLQKQRQEQDQAWMWERIEAGLDRRFREHPAVKAALPDISAQVQSGMLSPSLAATRLLDLAI